MLENYYKYDVKGMLSDLEKNRATLRNLERQYAALDGARALDYSVERVTSTPKADGLEKVAIRRVNLRRKIDRYRRDIELVDKCINALPEEEKIVISEFFLKNQGKAAAVVTLCDRLALEQSAVYSLRRKALKDFEQLIFG